MHRVFFRLIWVFGKSWLGKARFPRQIGTALGSASSILLVSSAQLFDTARNSLGELIRAASGTPHVSQDKIISLLAGPDQTGPESQRVKQELAYRISSALEAQRLVSLDTLFSLGDDLNRMAQGKPMPQGMIQ